MRYLLPNGVTAVNVYGVEDPTGAWDEAKLNDLLDVFYAWENDHADDYRSNEVAAVSASARELSAPDSFYIDRAFSPIIVGKTASPAMPANVTFCVKLGSNYAGRSRRGRTYWIGLSEAHITGNFVISVTVAGIQTTLQNLNIDLLTQGWRLVVLSRYEDGAERSTGLATPITSFTAIDSRVDTQRRRLPGIGS